MNYVENNGKKVAAVLCVASCFPVVATVYAMETEPGWHGDKYIKEDATVAKGWEEIEGKNYYFSEEDGSIEKDTTKKAVVASVSSNISVDVQKTVADVAKEAVVEEVKKQEKEEVKTPVEKVEVKQELPTVETLEVEDTTVEETPVAPVVPEAPEVQEPVVPETPEVQEPTIPEAPVAPVVPETPEVQEPVVPETPEVQEPTIPEAPVAPVVPEAPEVQEPVVPETPEVQEPAVPETPEVQQPVQPQPPVADVPSNGTLGDRIAAEAQKLVGVTDGMWCTQVVQQALANAGVQDAYQLWPSEYAGVYSGGVYNSTGSVGDLVYYNNGGNGVDHIAIYIGNGQAVHGNYWTNGQSQTVIGSVYEGGGGQPQYITVQR